MKEQEVVRLAMIDQKRKVRIEAQLQEKDINPKLEEKLTNAKIAFADATMAGTGNVDLREEVEKCQKELDEWQANRGTPDTVDVSEVAQKVSDYVADKLTGDDINVIRDQIYPFVSQVMSQSIVKGCGLDLAHFMLVSDLIKGAMIFNMAVAFLTFRFLKNNNYKIITNEEPISEQEIADYKRMSKENETAALAAIMGFSVDEFKEYMANQGRRVTGGTEDGGNGNGGPTTH